MAVYPEELTHMHKKIQNDKQSSPSTRVQVSRWNKWASSFSQATRLTRIGVEGEECVEQQAICFASLKRSMVAVLASYQRKTRVVEMLCEGSHKARLKTGHKAEDVACRHDALCQQWLFVKIDKVLQHGE